MATLVELIAYDEELYAMYRQPRHEYNAEREKCLVALIGANGRRIQAIPTHIAYMATNRARDEIQDIIRRLTTEVKDAHLVDIAATLALALTDKLQELGSYEDGLGPVE